MSKFIHAGYMTVTLSGDVLQHEERIEVGFNGSEYEARIERGVFADGAKLRDKDIEMLESKVIGFLNKREERKVTKIQTDISDSKFKEYQSNQNENQQQQKRKEESEKQNLQDNLKAATMAGSNAAKNSFAFLKSMGYVGIVLRFILTSFLSFPYLALIMFSYSFQGSKGAPFRANIFARSGGVVPFIGKLFVAATIIAFIDIVYTNTTQLFTSDTVSTQSKIVSKDNYIQNKSSHTTGLQTSQDVKLNPSSTNNITLEDLKNNCDLIHKIKNPTEEMQLIAIDHCGGDMIEYIQNPSEAVQLKAVQKNNASIRYIKNPSEAVQLESLKKNDYPFKYIKNPTEKVQLAALQQNCSLIEKIENPTEEMKLLVLRRCNGSILKFINNPTEEMKIMAALTYPYAKDLIKNPSKEIDIAHDTISYPNLFQDMKNPSENVQIVFVQRLSENIKYIKNPSEAVKIAAVTQSASAIQHIENPSEAVQLALVHNHPHWFRYIKNPSEVAQLALVHNYPEYIKLIKNPSEKVQFEISKLNATGIKTN